MPNPTFVATTTQADPASSNPETLTLALPSGAAVGDLLVVALTAQSSNATAAYPSASSGTWSQRTQISGTGRYGAIMTKVVESGDSSFTFTFPSFGASTRQEGILVAIRDTAGVDQETAWFRSAAGTSIGSTGLTGVAAGALLLYFHFAVTSAGAALALGTDPPTGWTKIGPVAQDPTGTAASSWLFGFYKTGSAGGSESAPSSTVTGTSGDWKTAGMSFTPAPAPPFIWTYTVRQGT